MFEFLFTHAEREAKSYISKIVKILLFHFYVNSLPISLTSLLLTPLNLSQIFDFFISQKSIDVFKVFFNALVAKLKNFISQSIKEIAIVRDKDQCSVKCFQCIF